MIPLARDAEPAHRGGEPRTFDEAA
jgi:hypothetical protein